MGALLLLLLSFPQNKIAFAAPPAASDRLTIKETAGPRDVKVLRQGSEAKSELVQPQGEVFVGDVVVSGERQVVTLEAFDGSVWKIAPSSRLKVEARVPQKKNFFHWTFGLHRGSMWGAVKSRPEADGFRLKVKTRNAAMGIRGTEYLIESKEDKTELDVLEGIVWFGNASGFEPGTYVEVRAGQHAEIGKDGVPQPPVPSVLRGTALAEKYGLGVSR
jgi:ferric-dicitrate binding protein FerR (iron transport regulator)